MSDGNFMKDCFTGRDMVSSLTHEDPEEPGDTSSSATPDTSIKASSSSAAPSTSSSGAIRTPKRKMSKTDKLIEFENKKLLQTF